MNLQEVFCQGGSVWSSCLQPHVRQHTMFALTVQGSTRVRQPAEIDSYWQESPRNHFFRVQMEDYSEKPSSIMAC